MIYTTLMLENNITVIPNFHNKVIPFTLKIGELEISLNEQELTRIVDLGNVALIEYTNGRNDK